MQGWYDKLVSGVYDPRDVTSTEKVSMPKVAAYLHALEDTDATDAIAAPPSPILRTPSVRTSFLRTAPVYAMLTRVRLVNRCKLTKTNQNQQKGWCDVWDVYDGEARWI